MEIYLLEWFQATAVEGREVNNGTGHSPIDVHYGNLRYHLTWILDSGG